MAAVAYPSPHPSAGGDRPGGRRVRHLWVVPDPAPQQTGQPAAPSARPPVSPAVSPGTYRRRRLAAVAVLATLVVGLALAARAVLGMLGSGPPAAPEPSRSPFPPIAAGTVAVHVVQPGETLWSIARELRPHGDVRGVVDRLAARNGGAALYVGERLVLS